MKYYHFLLLIICMVLLGYQCKNKDKEGVTIENGFIDSTEVVDTGALKTLEKMGIEVKNELPEKVAEKVDEIIEKKEDSSFLKDKTPEEIIKLYEAFIKKYDPKNKTHETELHKWTQDPFFNAVKKDDKYIEQIESIEESLYLKKKGK